MEVKKTYTFEDRGQLADYMGAVGKVRGQGGITGVGFLMDENCLKLAVVLLCLVTGLYYHLSSLVLQSLGEIAQCSDMMQFVFCNNY